MKHYNHKAARSDAQLKKMQELSEEGICAFCPENIDRAEGKVLFFTDHWMVKENGFPYEHTKLHLLLVPKVHAATVSALPKDSQAEFLSVVAQCEKLYKLDSYALGMRSGDMRRNGGSVEHIHAHLIVGDTDDPKHEPVRFKMSNRPD